jgi:hypothetical protein
MGKSVFTPKYLAHLGPCGTGFAYLGTNSPDVVVVLGKEASEALKDLHSFQWIPMDGKLLIEGIS